jgi:methionyl-tRNA formyltransferase
MTAIADKRLVMCGCAESGWDLTRILLEIGMRFQYFVSISKEKAEQQQVSGYKDFSDLAAQFNIPIYYCKRYSLKSEEDLSFFKKNKFDLLIQGGWQRLFPQEILQTLSVGAVGVHGSSEFLPNGRGRSPINWSIIEGKKRFIFHYFLMKPGADDGDIFHYEICDINAWDDCETIYYKNTILTARTLANWTDRLLKKEFTLVPQKGEPTYYSKRTPEDGLIDWKKTVYEIFNFTRGITRPYPGAFAFLKNEKVVIWRAQPFDSRIVYVNAVPGEVVETFSNGDFVVNCLSGLLLVKEFEAHSPPKKRRYF